MRGASLAASQARRGVTSRNTTKMNAATQKLTREEFRKQKVALCGLSRRHIA